MSLATLEFPSHWFLVWVRPNIDFRVRDSLQADGHDVRCARRLHVVKHRRLRQHLDKVTRIEHRTSPLFPGWLVVRFGRPWSRGLEWQRGRDWQVVEGLSGWQRVSDRVAEALDGLSVDQTALPPPRHQAGVLARLSDANASFAGLTCRVERVHVSGVGYTCRVRLTGKMADFAFEVPEEQIEELDKGVRIKQTSAQRPLSR
jgi:hypothetical protein